MEQFDGYLVRGADKGHSSVPGRAQDGYPLVHEHPAVVIDVFDAVGQMAEISTAGVGFLLVPVIGQIDLRLAGGGGEENQSEPARLNLLSSGFHQPKGVGKEINRLVKVGNAYHGVQVFHDFGSFGETVGFRAGSQNDVQHYEFLVCSQMCVVMRDRRLLV